MNYFLSKYNKNLFNEFPSNYPVDLFLGNVLPYDVQLLILNIFNENQRYEFLIEHFLITKFKFNIFKNSTEFVCFLFNLTKTNNLNFNLKITKYFLITKFHLKLKTEFQVKIIKNSVKFLNFEIFEIFIVFTKLSLKNLKIITVFYLLNKKESFKENDQLAQLNILKLLLVKNYQFVKLIIKNNFYLILKTLNFYLINFIINELIINFNEINEKLKYPIWFSVVAFLNNKNYLSDIFTNQFMESFKLILKTVTDFNQQDETGKNITDYIKNIHIDSTRRLFIELIEGIFSLLIKKLKKMLLIRRMMKMNSYFLMLISE